MKRKVVIEWQAGLLKLKEIIVTLRINYFCNYLAEAACRVKHATLFATLTRRQKDFNGLA
jgi:hypothetical protein